MSELSSRERSLVALGAALASNCLPCIEYHIPGARSAGLSDIEINEALRIADKVREVPARAVLETALAMIDTPADGSAEPAGSVCGCGETEKSIETDGVC